MGWPLYHADLRIERCTVAVRLNDLVIAELTAESTPEWFAPPLNPYLVGEGNILAIDVWPMQGGTIGDADVSGVVRRYEKGEPVAPGSGPAVIEVTVMSELAERIREAREQEVELDIPQSFMFIFDNEGPNFAPELSDAEPFADENALRDYAIMLRDLMRAGDAAGLGAQMAPKVTAYAAAFDDDRARIETGLAEVLQNDYVPQGFETDFEKADVELIAHCGGRVWELRKPGGLALIRTPEDQDGGRMELPVYVANTSDGLRIVR